MSDRLLLELGSSQGESLDDSLACIGDSLEEFGRTEHFPENLVLKLNLILEELALNALTHGGATIVRIAITADPEALTIDISDDGAPFDPLTEAPEPEVDAALEDRAIGGLGIHLVKQLTNDLSYRRDGDRNHLRLVTRSRE